MWGRFSDELYVFSVWVMVLVTLYLERTRDRENQLTLSHLITLYHNTDYEHAYN